MKGILAAGWGVFGVTLLLTSAIYRLGSRALEVFQYPMEWHHWMVLIAGVFFMAYSEGYRGFQKAFSPRVAARALYLLGNADFLSTLLAPLFLMCYFRAPKKRRIVSISLTVGIILLVLLVRLLPAPWRAIVDFGVVIGLAWGLASMLFFSFVALRARSFSHSPEVC